MVQAELVVEQLDACETDIISIVSLASTLVSLLQSASGEEDDRKEQFEAAFTTYMMRLDVRDF